MQHTIIEKIKTNRNTLQFFKFGKGSRTFVIIPGLSLKSVMLSADAVVEAYQPFAEDYTVYLFDRSLHLHQGYTIDDMAEDTAEALSELGLKDICLFGASQGGMIAQRIAINHPSLVKRMVLGSTAPCLSQTSCQLLTEWIASAHRRDVVALNHSLFAHLYSEQTLNLLGDNLSQLEQDGTNEEMARFEILASACLGFNTQNELSLIKCPTLVIGAQNDRVLGGEASVELSKRIRCQLFMYEGEHAIYDEAIDYKDRLLAFFHD